MFDLNSTVLDQIVITPDHLFVLLFLAIVLSVLLRYTDSDYPFGILKLFSHKTKKNKTKHTTQF